MRAPQIASAPSSRFQPPRNPQSALRSMPPQLRRCPPALPRNKFPARQSPEAHSREQIRQQSRNRAIPQAPHSAPNEIRKRSAIMAAATALFLRNGYQGTSMDEIAALAAVSKQTVYKNFADKERLFTDIVLGISGRSDEIIRGMTGDLRGSADL